MSNETELAAGLQQDCAAIERARKTTGQVEPYLAALAYRVEAHLPAILAALQPPAAESGEGRDRRDGLIGEMLEALHQYVSDLRYPPEGDSIQRRIERAERVIAKAADVA